MNATVRTPLSFDLKNKPIQKAPILSKKNIPQKRDSLRGQLSRPFGRMDRRSEKIPIMYRKYVCRGNSITEVQRPEKERVYLSKNSYPLQIGGLNSLLEINGVLLNSLDPQYQETDWKVLLPIDIRYFSGQLSCNCKCQPQQKYCRQKYCQCQRLGKMCNSRCSCSHGKSLCFNNETATEVDYFQKKTGCICEKGQCVKANCGCKQLGINCGPLCKCKQCLN